MLLLYMINIMITIYSQDDQDCNGSSVRANLKHLNNFLARIMNLTHTDITVLNIHYTFVKLLSITVLIIHASRSFENL